MKYKPPRARESVFAMYTFIIIEESAGIRLFPAPAPGNNKICAYLKEMLI